MAKQNKFKFYTQRNNYLPIKFSGKNHPGGILLKIAGIFFRFFYLVGKGFLSVLLFFKKILATIFLFVGNLVIYPIEKALHKFKEDISQTKKNFPKRLEMFKNKKTFKSVLAFVLMAAMVLAVFGALNLIAKTLQIKNSVLQTSASGIAYLNSAKEQLSEKNFDSAKDNFSLAEQAFKSSEAELRNGGALLNAVLNLLPQKHDADKLIESAKLISSAGQNFVDLEKQTNLLKISPAGITSQDGASADVIQNINSELIVISSKLNLAKKLTGQVNITILPQGQQQTFSDLKNKLSSISFVLDNFIKVSSFVKDCLSGQKTILVLFENNNELRATGGFIGTFGNIKMKDGEITKMNVSSVYDLDGQLQENIQPPSPILNMSDRLFFRDSNWFADFPTSAQTLSNFYEKEGGETPDIIIAMTPNFIINLLKITGPIALPKYGVTLNEDNFIEKTQAVSTISDNLPTNSPKQILADLVPLLLQKISQANKDQLSQIAQGLQNNLNEKQIVIYSRDQDLQTQATNFHWDGGILDTDRDYLSVISSNLGGTKSDLNIEQKINLNTTINNDGSVNEELSITRINTLPRLDGTENDSFLRIYVPLGSKLISNTGFDQKNLVYPDGENYKTDDRIYAWEKNSVKDAITGTTIGQESGKTIFGNWVNVKGGEIKTVKIVYQPPFKLKDTDRYSLLLQKQIGAAKQSFSWNLNYDGRKINWKNFTTEKMGSNSLNSDIILNKDNLFGLVLTKN